MCAFASYWFRGIEVLLRSLRVRACALAPPGFRSTFYERETAEGATLAEGGQDRQRVGCLCSQGGQSAGRARTREGPQRRRKALEWAPSLLLLCLPV